MTAPIENKKQVDQTTQTQDQGQENPQNVNVFALAFCLVVEAAITVGEHATIEAKGLQKNAASEQKLNQEANGIGWYSVPSLNRHTDVHKDPHYHHETVYKVGEGFVTITVTTYTYKNTYRFTGQSAVDAAQAKNQQLSAERTQLNQKMAVLQQQSQVGMAQVNSTCDEVSQIMSQGKTLQDTLQQVSWAALIRHPVQS